MAMAMVMKYVEEWDERLQEPREGKALLLAVLAWSAAFATLRFVLLPKRSGDFCNRFVSQLHVVVALVLSSLSVQDWSHPFHPLAAPASPLQIRAMSVSLAYFVYDFLCCLILAPGDISTAVHHIVSILSLAYGFFYATSGTELVACLWLMELSNPFMHAREMLKDFGLKDTWVNLCNDACFALIFTCARLVIGPYLVFVTLRANNPLLVKLGAVGMQLVSLFWFYKIVRLVRYKLLKGYRSRSKKL
ncbi:hypothetical protein O6H91_16G044700 [Diphasiastrum complanatum]|uniref:Uncharacterized protein n=2 Tax=Diphasiastrum complanatum TaxID=34168 RepID=A0ACC2BAM7_DIPCM|nr:hypothetical protein O6H91_16G025000 [Diphasiastrum complanatum]KAJ7527253.1 hypothetical protein O6H91_16G044700 [Diphasiastrum complanatum]